MHQVTLINQRRFAAAETMSILDAARTQGIVLEHSCRNARCGICKTPVLRGETLVLRAEESLTDAERDQGLILSCCRAAASDIELGVEDLGRLAELPVRTVPCRIATLERLSPTVMRIVLRMPPTADFRYLPGQYVDVILRGERRSYSIAGLSAAGGLIELHVKRFEGGLFSRYWFEEAAANDLLRLEGPLGTFFLRDVAASSLVFLATGTGIAPVKAMIEEMAAEPMLVAGKVVRIYWGNREVRDFYWRPDPAMTGVRFERVLSGDAPWSERRGHVQQALLADMDDLSDCVVYACGSETMINEARALLTRHGLGARRFLSDAFVSSS